MDQGQGETDRNSGKPDGCTPRCAANNDKEKEKRHHNLGYEAAAEAVFAWTEIAVSIGSETTDDPARLTRRDPPQYQGSDYRADDLGDDIRNDVTTGAAPGAPQAHGDRRVEMATRNATDGISHG